MHIEQENTTSPKTAELECGGDGDVFCDYQPRDIVSCVLCFWLHVCYERHSLGVTFCQRHSFTHARLSALYYDHIFKQAPGDKQHNTHWTNGIVFLTSSLSAN